MGRAHSRKPQTSATFSWLGIYEPPGSLLLTAACPPCSTHASHRRRACTRRPAWARWLSCSGARASLMSRMADRMADRRMAAWLPRAGWLRACMDDGIEWRRRARSCIVHRFIMHHASCMPACLLPVLYSYVAGAPTTTRRAHCSQSAPRNSARFRITLLERGLPRQELPAVVL